MFTCRTVRTNKIPDNKLSSVVYNLNDKVIIFRTHVTIDLPNVDRYVFKWSYASQSIVWCYIVL